MQQETDLIEASMLPSEASRLEVAQHLLDGIHVHIRAADEKIRVLFGGTALLAAALAFEPQSQLPQAASGTGVLLNVAAVVLQVLLLVCVACAVTSAIFALLPRVRLGSVERSLYFFGSIAATPHDNFIAEFGSLPDNALTRQILSQVHSNALIVSTKYVWTRRAATAFAAAVLLLLAKQGLSLWVSLP